MAPEYWKTGTKQTKQITLIWPSFSQILMQLGIISLIIVLWSVAFVAFLSLTNKPEQTSSQASFSPTSVSSNNNNSNSNNQSDSNSSNTTSNDNVPPTTNSNSTLITPSASPLPTDVVVITTTIPVTSDIKSVSDQTEDLTDTSTPTPEPIPTETPVSANDSDDSDDSDKSSEGESISFAQDVLPIFEKRCVKCHGGEDTEEGLVLKTYDDVMAGSWNGEIVEPGNVDKSYLIELIVEGDMPKKAPKLLPKEIKAITAWVEAGAPNN